MDTRCHVAENEIVFVLSDVDPAYHQAVRDLGYSETNGAFRRTLPVATRNLDHLCGNFERYAEVMVLQTARVQPVPWEQALRAFLDLVEPFEINWWLAGSAALAVRGLDVQPRDFDIVVDDASAQTLGVVLQDYLVEPVSNVDWFCNWWGHAFLHARFEWVGGVDARADEPLVSDFGPTAASRLEQAIWNGTMLRVPPLDLQLEASKRRGLSDRVAKIERLLERTR
jgi:hypothetical protein